MDIKFYQKLFLHLLRGPYSFYSSINKCDVSHWLIWDSKESMCPWDKSHLIMVYDPFNVLLDSIYCYFEDFCVFVHQWYWLVIICFGDISVWFWYQSDAHLIEWIWKCSFLCNIVEWFEKIDVNYSLNIW